MYRIWAPRSGQIYQAAIGHQGLVCESLQVAAGAAEYYTQQLAIIPKLTLQGCQQLTADLEYFCNVLAALGACIPAALSTWLIASQWSDEEFQQAAKAAGEDMDSASLAAIAEARKAAL